MSHGHGRISLGCQASPKQQIVKDAAAFSPTPQLSSLPVELLDLFLPLQHIFITPGYESQTFSSF